MHAPSLPSMAPPWATRPLCLNIIIPTKSLPNLNVYQRRLGLFNTSNHQHRHTDRWILRSRRYSACSFSQQRPNRINDAPPASCETSTNYERRLRRYTKTKILFAICGDVPNLLLTLQPLAEYNVCSVSLLLKPFPRSTPHSYFCRASFTT